MKSKDFLGTRIKTPVGHLVALIAVWIACSMVTISVSGVAATIPKIVPLPLKTASSFGQTLGAHVEFLMTEPLQYTGRFYVPELDEPLIFTIKTKADRGYEKVAEVAFAGGESVRIQNEIDELLHIINASENSERLAQALADTDSPEAIELGQKLAPIINKMADKLSANVGPKQDSAEKLSQLMSDSINKLAANPKGSLSQGLTLARIKAKKLIVRAAVSKLVYWTVVVTSVWSLYSFFQYHAVLDVPYNWNAIFSQSSASLLSGLYIFFGRRASSWYMQKLDRDAKAVMQSHWPEVKDARLQKYGSLIVNTCHDAFKKLLRHD